MAAFWSSDKTAFIDIRAGHTVVDGRVASIARAAEGSDIVNAKTSILITITRGESTLISVDTIGSNPNKPCVTLTSERADSVRTSSFLTAIICTEQTLIRVIAVRTITIVARVTLTCIPARRVDTAGIGCTEVIIGRALIDIFTLNTVSLESSFAFASEGADSVGTLSPDTIAVARALVDVCAVPAVACVSCIASTSERTCSCKSCTCGQGSAVVVAP